MSIIANELNCCQFCCCLSFTSVR